MSSTTMLRSALFCLAPLTLASMAVGCTDEAEKADEGGADGASDGATDGSADGTADGSADGAADGSADGSADGTADGSEVEVYGPENAWYHAPLSEVPEDRSGTGIGRGATLGDFTLLDQNGDSVSLYQFYGKTVQIVLFAEWCGPCNAEAPDIEAASRELGGDDVQIISVMLQQNDGSEPDLDALGRWVSAYSVTHPLLAGTAELEAMLQGGFPTLPVLDGEMTIVNLDNYPFNPDYLLSVE